MSPRPRAELDDLVALMEVLRDRCPWDARQTHRSLVTYLVEETGEVVDAVEAGSDDDMVEELGDLLLQVVFHARIAEQEGRFDIHEVAGGIVTKLRRRHPHVFADAPVPDDMDRTWEARKAAEKGRDSCLDGIAESLSSLARAVKVIARARKHGVPVVLPAGAGPISAEEVGGPISAEEVGDRIVALVARAHAQGIDADQATRDAVRRMEAGIRAAEGCAPSGADR